MAGAARTDHQAIAFFKVEIEGIDSASFRKCSGLKTETDVYEYAEGGDNETVRKLIGQTKAGNIVLTKGYVSDPALFAWRDQVASRGDNKVTRKSGSVVALGPDLSEIGRWNFQKAWPVRWEMSEFDASSGEASCEILELAVEKVVKGT
jgi:phage tail-like protein